MPFQKGKEKTGGRTKGTPNKVTEDLREKVSHILESQYETILKDLNKLEPKDRINIWIKLLEYALPKLQRSETKLKPSDNSPYADWTDEQIDEELERLSNHFSIPKFKWAEVDETTKPEDLIENTNS